MEKTFGSNAMHAIEDQVRANMNFFSEAMRMWTPFTQPQQPETGRPAPQPSAEPSDIDLLKKQMADMQAKLETLSRK